MLDLILEKLSNHISLQLQSHLCILNSISDTYSSIFAHYANQLGIVASCIDSIAQLCLHQSSSSLALLSASSPPSSSTSPSSSQPPLHPTSPFNFLHAQAILKCMKESMLYFTPDPILLHPSTSLKTLPPFIISQGYDLGLPASHHPNEYKAFRWALQAAATSRDPLSQFRLALRYRAALGTAFDESVGNKYLLVAAKGGCEAARAELLRLVELGHVDQALVNIFSSSSSSTTTSSSASAISSSEVTLLQHLHSKFSRSSSHSDNSFNEDSKMPVSLSLSAEALALSDKVARDGDWSVSCCHLVKQEHATVLQILLDGFKYIR